MKKTTKAVIAGLTFLAGCEIGLSIQLGEGFEQADTPEKMADAVMERMARGGKRNG